MWMYFAHTLPTTVTNRGPVLQAVAAVADFNLMLTFFLKTGEVPQAPLLQNPRKYLGGKERNQPPFSAQDFSWTCSRVAWRPISIQNLFLSKVQGSSATSSGDQSLSQRCSVVLLVLSLTSCEAGINNSNLGNHYLPQPLTGTVSPGVWEAGKVLDSNTWARRIKPRGQHPQRGICLPFQQQAFVNWVLMAIFTSADCPVMRLEH